MKRSVLSIQIFFLVSFAIFLFSSVAGAETAFAPGADYTSTNPAFIASGDLNNDGRTDLIVANWSADTITVFLGNSDGTFTVQSPVSVGVHPNSIAAGFFNNDANLDLAVANGGGIRDVTLLIGNGSGGFSNVTSLDVSVEGYPTTGDADINYIVSGDFDNDGKTDLALSKNTGYPELNDHIKIMKGDGSGGFTPLSSTNVGDSVTGPYGVASGYFNNDTDLDLAVTMFDSGTLKILLGDGSGGFTEASGSPITVGTIPSRIINADLNDDGEADLIVTNYTSNTISVLLGNGDGTFTSASGSPISTGTGPNALAAAFIDPDGNLDLVVANSVGSTFSVFAGNGDGTFKTRKDFATGAGPGFLVARDFDADGKTDIAIAHSSLNKISVFLQTECMPPPSGLVAWWPGDGNAQDVIGTNHYTLMNGPSFATGMVGLAFNLNGSNQYAFGSRSANSPTPLTMDAWINFRGATGSNQLVYYNGDVSAHGYGIYLMNNGTLAVRLGGKGYIQTGAVLSPNTWYHVAAVWNNAVWTIYLNGVSLAITTGNAATAPNIPTTGNSFIGATGSAQFFNGLIDEVEFFNQALSAPDIAALYNAGTAGKCRSCAAVPSGMVAWWKGDGNTVDAVGTYHGSLQGETRYDSGRVGEAFSFDGEGDYMQTGDIDLPSNFTIDTWINPDSLTGAQVLVSKDNADAYRSYYLAFDSGGKLLVSVRNTTGAFTQYRTDNIVLSAGQWNHIAATYDGGAAAGQKVKFYVNGVNAGAASLGGYDAGGTPENNALAVTLGMLADGVSGPYSGLIDEVEIFNRALSSSEIAAIYNAGNAGKCFTADTTPNTITFDPVTGAARSTPYTSNTVVISGINIPAEITITGGAYSVGCTATFISTESTVVNGDTVCVRQTSSGSYNTPTTATLTIGGVSADFDVTTLLSHTVQVSPSGTMSAGASVGITSDLGSIACNWNGSSAAGTCTSGDIDEGSQVILTANLPAGTTIDWGTGCDATTATTCTINSLTSNMTISPVTTAQTFTITVTGAGVNGGTMSGGSAINAAWNGSATGGTSSEQVIYGGGPVSILATGNTGVHATWSGDCDSIVANGTGSATCTINAGISANKNILATFSEYPVRRFTTVATGHYMTIEAAYADAGDAEEIQAQSGPFGDLYLDRPVSVTLKGGYSEGFSTNGGYSTVGVVTVVSGTVTVDRIAVQ
ncbi:MAG: VCBS repeat-containing protein [Nitrospirae bacterium]|nr:VCBS repeat-containing protein [Nitrospirota bacterium]